MEHQLRLSREKTLVDMGGKPFQLTLYFAPLDGAPRCVGVEIHSVELGLVGDAVTGTPIGGGWHEVTQQVVRSVDVTGAVESAWRRAQEAGAAAASLAAGRPVSPWETPPAVAPADAESRAVAQAYAGSPRGGRVQAVRDAMARERGVEVSRDDANRAIKRARKIGLLPPAAYKRRESK